MAMELRALFLLPLCFPGLPGQTQEVQRRREGDTLYIECSYAAQTKDQDPKYWCLLRDGGCQEVLYIYSYELSKQSRDKRTKINDDTTTKTLSISMTDLKAEDSGTYFCAVYQHYKYIPLRMISLIVFNELLRWELDTLTVQCPQGYVMAWCRGGQTDCTAPGRRQTSSKQSEMKSLQDRASVEYNAQRALVVTMKNLQSRDSGVYWCALGSERARKMEVVLSVFKRTQQLRAKESGNVSVRCHYKIADHRTVSKAWCKKEEGKTCNVLVTTRSESPAANSTAREGVRIQDDSQQGIVTITMEQLQVQDSGVYWCALQDGSALLRMEEVTLNVSKALPPGGFPDSESQSEDSCSGNTFLILSVVLLLLLLLALLTSVALAVRYYRLLLRTGNREAEDTSDRPKSTAQPGSTGRRESSQHDSKGPAYINLDVQSHPSPEDPLYCNVELSQAPRSPQHVEYAAIAFNQSPGSSRE